jgi:cell division protein FtsQ
VGRRTAIAALVAIVLVALLVWLVGFSSVLGVKKVTVEGTDVLSTTQVVAAADITEGTPLLRLDTDAVRLRVMALPDVAAASVSTSWPNTVVIAVTERQPVGYVLEGSRYGLVDITGTHYRSVTTRPSRLPLLDLSTDDSTVARQSAAAVGDVASALPADLRVKVKTISALNPDAVDLALTDGRTVRWGSPERNAQKAGVLRALLARPATTIDITNPDLPYTH